MGKRSIISRYTNDDTPFDEGYIDLFIMLMHLSMESLGHQGAYQGI